MVDRRLGDGGDEGLEGEVVGLFEGAGEDGSGGLFVSATLELFGDGGDIDAGATAEADFDLTVGLLDGDEGAGGSLDSQAFVDEVFGVGGFGTCFGVVLELDVGVAEEAVAFELHPFQARGRRASCGRSSFARRGWRNIDRVGCRRP
jgi:hypothetical protein